MIPPGNDYSKTFVRMPAMMMKMKFMQLRKCLAGPFIMQNDMHERIAGKTYKITAKECNMVVSNY